MILSFILLLIYTLFLADKDATSYLLKDKNSPYDDVQKAITRRWHRDGVILFLLFAGVLSWATKLWWEVPTLSLLIRLAVYDVAFNYWSSLPITHLGTTSFVDKVFASVFGQEGAIKKSLVFAGVCLTFIVIKLLI